jgi:hypothetical protein
MRTKFLILFYSIFANCVHGTDSSQHVLQTSEHYDSDEESKYFYLNRKFCLKELKKKDYLEQLKVPLPEVLTFEKVYDFFDKVPEKLHCFAKNFLNFPDFQDGVKIKTLPGWLDRRAHVTEGKIGNIGVILKRAKRCDSCLNEREVFFQFMDAAKEKLVELEAIMDNFSLSKEEKKLRIQRIQKQLIGLGSIAPIIGITRIQRKSESSSGELIDEIIEVSLKAGGCTLFDRIMKRLPPYDTPQGVPRNQDIAIRLLLQLIRIALTLKYCDYIYYDFRYKNVMIDDSFKLSLIDWSHFKQAEEPSNHIIVVHKVVAMFCSILLGTQCSLGRYCPYFPTDKDDIKDFLKKCLRCLRRAGIYSRNTILTVMRIFKGVLLVEDDEKLSMEAILSILEKLLVDNGGKVEEEQSIGENEEI